MKTRFRKLSVESLENRSVLSATAFADFNSDGLVDMAAITDPNTITISLANPDGSYTVSDILSTPKNQPIHDIWHVQDAEGDGDLDIEALATKPSGSSYLVSFRNNGDGTFEFIEPAQGKLKFSRWWV
jgi:hypothetical protein